MATAVVLAAIEYLHVFSAVGWLGSAILFEFAIGPSLQSLSGPTRGELLLKVFPRVGRVILISSVLTLVFGFSYAYALSDGNFSIFTPSTNFGLSVTGGAILALVAAAVGGGVAGRTASRMTKLVKEMQAGPPGPLPAEMDALAKRLKVYGTLGFLLLALVLALMVAAGNF